MSEVFYPRDYAKKVLPKGFWRRTLTNNKFGMKRQSLKALTTARAIDGRAIKETIYNTLEEYELKYRALRKEGVSSHDAFSEAVNDEALLKQRIENAVVYDKVQDLRVKYKGKRFRWLPSGAKVPRAEHQLKYGKIYNVDDVEYLPGEEWGCDCGAEYFD